MYLCIYIYDKTITYQIHRQSKIIGKPREQSTSVVIVVKRHSSDHCVGNWSYTWTKGDHLSGGGAGHFRHEMESKCTRETMLTTNNVPFGEMVLVFCILQSIFRTEH